MIEKLRNPYTDGDAIYALKNYFYSGFNKFKQTVYKKESEHKWLLFYLYKINQRMHSLYLGWPIYPKTFKPNEDYRRRIGISYNDLQETIERYFYVMCTYFPRPIPDTDWQYSIELAVNIICDAYEDDVKDEFGYRKGLVIVRPDERYMSEVRREIIAFKKQDIFTMEEGK